MKTTYDLLTAKKKQLVDITIAVDLASGGMGQNPYNYDHLKGLSDKDYLTGIRDHIAEHILDANELALRQAANDKGVDTRNPTNSFPDNLKLAAQELAGRRR